MLLGVCAFFSFPCVSFLAKESAGVPLLRRGGGAGLPFPLFMLVLLFLWCLHTGPCLLRSILATLRNVQNHVSWSVSAVVVSRLGALCDTELIIIEIIDADRQQGPVFEIGSS